MVLRQRRCDGAAPGLSGPESPMRNPSRLYSQQTGLGGPAFKCRCGEVSLGPTNQEGRSGKRTDPMSRTRCRMKLMEAESRSRQGSHCCPMAGAVAEATERRTHRLSVGLKAAIPERTLGRVRKMPARDRTIPCLSGTWPMTGGMPRSGADSFRLADEVAKRGCAGKLNPDGARTLVPKRRRRSRGVRTEWRVSWRRAWQSGPRAVPWQRDPAALESRGPPTGVGCLGFMRVRAVLDDRSTFALPEQDLPVGPDIRIRLH